MVKIDIKVDVEDLPPKEFVKRQVWKFKSIAACIFVVLRMVSRFTITVIKLK